MSKKTQLKKDHSMSVTITGSDLMPPPKANTEESGERWLITHESSAQYRAARSEVYNGTIQQFLSERKNTYITYAVKL